MESATAVSGNTTMGAQNGMDMGRVIRMIIETCPKCGGELKHISLTTYPPEREKDTYTPFDERKQSE